MRVAVDHSNNDVRIEEREIPQPGPGEILVKTAACGVCVADTMEWDLANRAPLVLGHEPTGAVEKVGPGVEKFKPGDRVFVHHHVACLHCEYCRKGNFTMCKEYRPTNLFPGGFSEYFIASSAHVERDTLKLPSSVSFEHGTLIEPLACVVHAVRKAKVKPGDSVALIGTGAMGLMFIDVLKAYGVRRLVVYEIDPWRAAKAKEIGAPEVWTPGRDPQLEGQKLREYLHSEGADIVFVAAKDIAAIEMGLSLANKGGTVLFFATPSPDEFVKLYPSRVFFAEQTITASYSADHIDTRLALELLASGSIHADTVITHQFPLEELSSAILQTASRGECLKSIIKIA